jgi:urease accessory protein
MMFYSFTASMMGASLRLGMLNHFDGQGIIHELKPLILEIEVQKHQNPDKQ